MPAAAAGSAPKDGLRRSVGRTSELVTTQMSIIISAESVNTVPVILAILDPTNDPIAERACSG
jgi:hypothetical protein